MPELPEMENYRLLLTGRITQRPITEVDVQREKSINVEPAAFAAALLGRRIERIERRAKHLLFYLDSPDVLVLHLMLGGVLFYGRPEEQPDRTVQVRLGFGEDKLFFIGLRLGYLHLHEAAAIPGLMAKLGPDPFDPTLPAVWRERLTRGSRTLKASLVDQTVISGIGNCYSDEICFAAGLLPARRTATLTEAELSSLLAAMRSVLSEATQLGGYMDMPLFRGDALTGGFDARCRVYDREGEPCVRCGAPIVRQDTSSKKSYCCLRCQR